ncbi:MAG TPA: virulence factor MviM, partial [Erwinia persicina]|nr:virulence factor MviM [Erwinia persicina]
MSGLKVGIVGLGGIAQKAWLPVLTCTDGWQIAGAFSPNQEKARPICDSYRIPLLATLDDLAAASDAVFVHSSTASHYAIVDRLLRAGVDVCVDKPLAATLSEAERLVELADRRGRKLMVAFNRRFGPRYQQLRAGSRGAAPPRREKPRRDSVGPQDLRFTQRADHQRRAGTPLCLGPRPLPLGGGSPPTHQQGPLTSAG